MKTMWAIAGALLVVVVVAGATAGVRQEPIQPVAQYKDTDPAKTELGKMLFFDPRLSKSGFISCNSCHNLATGGVDALPSSIGDQWQLGPINSPTVLNASHNFVQFWDGRAKDLVEQAGGPMENPKEMASSRERVVATLRSIPGYVDQFEKVYGTKDLTIDQVTNAIAHFEETLVTPDAPFDHWLEGDDKAISESARQGYELFKSKGCIACHNGVNVGGGSFQKFGVVKPYEKDTTTLGRYDVTKDEADKYVFKVPTLRNITLTAPYLHDGSLWKLDDVVNVMANYQLGVPVNDEERGKIVAFLASLTAPQPKVDYPVLPPSGPETPRPERN